MHSRIEREAAEIVATAFKQDGYWRDVLAKSWLDTANDCVTIFHTKEPRAHIVQGEHDNILYVGTNPQENIEVAIEMIETKLRELGLPLYGWK